MRKILFTLTFVLFAASIHAEEKSVLSVLMKDGTNVCFYLSEQPLVKFAGDDVKIISTTEEATIPRTLVDHFEFLNEMPTAIDEIEMAEDKTLSNHVVLSGDKISVSGLISGGCVRLFSLKGQQLASIAADSNGHAQFSAESLPAGIYLINYNETTIKFVKR